MERLVDVVSDIVRLAEEPDFTAGTLRIRPSRGEVEHEGVVERVEPRLMQVLVVLARAGGQTVSRQELIARCWGGVVVSPDAVSRAISMLRRLIDGKDQNARVETLSRIGYRLTLQRRDQPDLSAVEPIVRDLYRRAMLGLEQPSREPLEQALAYLKEVVARASGFAPGWAALAEAQRLLMLYLPPSSQQAACVESRSSAERALALDPELGECHGTLANLLPRFGNWSRVERLFQNGLAASPANSKLLYLYAQFLLSVGRTTEGLERLVALQERNPLSAAIAVDIAAALSDVGRVEEALAAISRAYARWPAILLVWSECVRLHVVADKFDRGEALLSSPPSVVGLGDLNIARRRLHLAARRYRGAPEMAAAVRNFQDFAQIGIAPAAVAVHALSALDQPEAALAVANEIFVSDSPQSRRPGVNMMGTFTLAGEPDSTILFRRETANMRRLPGFKRIVDRIGLSDYWEHSDSTPDFLAVDRNSGAPVNG